MRSRQEVTAFIYDKRGHVLAVGKNSYCKTHPMMVLHGNKVGRPEKIYLHAEVHAIVRCKDLSKAHKIVVMRFDKKGNPMCAKPCPVCQSAIEAAGIMIVEHT